MPACINKPIEIVFFFILLYLNKCICSQNIEYRFPFYRLYTRLVLLSTLFSTDKFKMKCFWIAPCKCLALIMCWLLRVDILSDKSLEKYFYIWVYFIWFCQYRIRLVPNLLDLTHFVFFFYKIIMHNEIFQVGI